MLQKESGEDLPAGGFRGTAALKSQTVPLPVEIATDIARITEEGKIEKKKEKDSKENKDKASSGQTNKDNQEANRKEQTRGRAKGGDSEQIVTSTDEEHPLSGRKKFSRKVSGGKEQKYKIKKGDTLMKIAFAKYGDVFRWRDIYEANREVLKDFNRLQIGAVLVIHGVEFVVIEKNGEPYLIRRGDTLRSISQKLYGTPTEWRALWKNNKQLIHNPNKIYAGFVLYYRPKTGPAPSAPEIQPQAEVADPPIERSAQQPE